MHLTYHKDELTLEDGPYESDEISNISQSNGEPLHQDEEEELPNPDPRDEEEVLPVPDRQEAEGVQELSLEEEADRVLPHNDIHTSSEILDQKLMAQPSESPGYAMELFGIQLDEFDEAALEMKWWLQLTETNK